MKNLTNEYAESLADELLVKINEFSNRGIKLTLANGDAISKEYLVNSILGNTSAYLPFKRTIQFDDLQDETVRNICTPVGKVTMAEIFNKGFSIEELLNIDFSDLDVHCEGVNSNGVISYGIPSYCSSSSKDSYYDKYYSVTYTGTSSDGTNFRANAIYNTIDPNKKDYYISRIYNSTPTKTLATETNIITSSDFSANSNGCNTTKRIKIGDDKYFWNQYEGIVNENTSTPLYSWKDSITEASGVVLTNATCTYDNANYSGVPVEFSVNDFSTGSSYKEENGIIEYATGSLSIICRYDKDGSIILEKPSFSKTESATIVSNNLSKINKDCIGLISVTTNSVTNSKEIVITPNFAKLNNPCDVSKIVYALKNWNIGLDSSPASLQGNNIWINTAKGYNSFAEDGTYVINNYVSLSNYIK